MPAPIQPFTIVPSPSAAAAGAKFAYQPFGRATSYAGAQLQPVAIVDTETGIVDALDVVRVHPSAATPDHFSVVDLVQHPRLVDLTLGYNGIDVRALRPGQRVGYNAKGFLDRDESQNDLLRKLEANPELRRQLISKLAGLPKLLTGLTHNDDIEQKVTQFFDSPDVQSIVMASFESGIKIKKTPGSEPLDILDPPELPEAFSDIFNPYDARYEVIALAFFVGIDTWQKGLLGNTDFERAIFSAFEYARENQVSPIVAFAQGINWDDQAFGPSDPKSTGQTPWTFDAGDVVACLSDQNIERAYQWFAADRAGFLPDLMAEFRARFT